MLSKAKKEKRDSLMKNKTTSNTSLSPNSAPKLRSSKSSLNTKKNAEGAEIPVQLHTMEATSNPPIVEPELKYDKTNTGASEYAHKNKNKNTGGTNKTRKRESPNKASIPSKKKEKTSKLKQKSGKEVQKTTRKRSRSSSNQSIQPKIEKRLEKSEQYDALLGEAHDLMGAAAEAQALGRLKLASSYMLLLHARLVGLGKIFDRAIASEPRLKSAVHFILSQDRNNSFNSQKESCTQEEINNLGNVGKNDSKTTNLAPVKLTNRGDEKGSFINSLKEETKLQNSFTSINVGSEVEGTLHPQKPNNNNNNSQGNPPLLLSSESTKQTSHVSSFSQKPPYATTMNTRCNGPNDIKKPGKNETNINNTPQSLEILNEPDKENHLTLHPNTSSNNASNVFSQNQNIMPSAKNSSTFISLSTNQVEMQSRKSPELKAQSSSENALHRPPLPLKTPISTTPPLSSLTSESTSISANQTSLKSSLPSPLQENRMVHSAEAALLLTKALPKEINLDTTMMEHLAKAALELHQKRLNASSNGSSNINPSSMKTVITTGDESMRTKKYSTTLSSLSSALLPQQEEIVKKDKIIAWSEEEKRTCEKASDIYGTSNPDKITEMMRGTRTETEVRAHLKTKEEKEKVDRELSDMNISIAGNEPPITLKSGKMFEKSETSKVNDFGRNVSVKDKTKRTPKRQSHSTTALSEMDNGHVLITNDNAIKHNDIASPSISNSNGKDSSITTTSINTTESVNEPTKSRSRTNVFSHFDARLMIMQGGGLPTSAFTPVNPSTTSHNSISSNILEKNKPE